MSNVNVFSFCALDGARQVIEDQAAGNRRRILLLSFGRPVSLKPYLTTSAALTNQYCWFCAQLAARKGVLSACE